MKTPFVFYHACEKAQISVYRNWCWPISIQARVLSIFDLLFFTCTPLTQAVINQRPDIGCVFPGFVCVFPSSHLSIRTSRYQKKGAFQSLLPPVWQQAVLSALVMWVSLSCWLKDMGSRHLSVASLSHCLIYPACHTGYMRLKQASWTRKKRNITRSRSFGSDKHLVGINVFKSARSLGTLVPAHTHTHAQSFPLFLIKSLSDNVAYFFHGCLKLRWR